jgi:DNA-binding transcriptional ArsR family regulator
MPEASVRARAAAFAALGDGTRLRLLGRLRGGRQASIAALTRGARMSRQAVAKHLRVLERARMVEARRAGRERRYALNPAAFADLEAFLTRAARGWDARLERLKRAAESQP